MTEKDETSKRRRKRQRKKRSNAQKVAEQLPKEVLELILLRLPLLFIFRFKLICKKWNSIISDPEFVIEVFRRQSLSNTHMIIAGKVHYFGNYYERKPKPKPEIYALDFCEDVHSLPTTTSRSMDARNWFGCLYPRILGSYNGLVAVACDEIQYVLWNPLTRKYKSFACRYAGYVDSSGPMPHILYGLCYDDSSNEYSVVVTSEFQSPPVSPTNFDDINFGGGGSVLTNLSTGRCKMMGYSTLGLRLLDRRLFHGGIGKVICGFPHWLLSFYDGEKPMVQREIIYFDFKDEVYKQLERPRATIGVDKVMVGLSCLGGERELGMVLHDILYMSLDVWAMKEYGNVESWTKLFTISTSFDRITQSDYMELLGFLPTGEILIDVNLEKFWAYDVEKESARQIMLGGGISREEFNALTRYFPSVVSPPGRVSNEHKRTKKGNRYKKSTYTH